MDNPAYKEEGILYRWGPIDNNFYSNEKQEKTIELSFIGNQYDYRKVYLEEIKKRNVEVQCFGGIGYKWSEFKLVDIFKKSKMTINFSLDAYGRNHQVKGRVYEAIAAECLLFEMKNPLTEMLFEPFADYVPWENIDDLVEKINYYGSNDAEREKIVKSGRKKILEVYNMENWYKLGDIVA